MINTFYKFLIIVIGATICCPFAMASCEFKMNNIQYFHQNGSSYKVKIKIAEVCSSNAIYKRAVKNIEMNIYKENQKLVTLNFPEGLWMPSQSKFFFKSSSVLEQGCFKGAKSITLYLKSNIINSIDGHYFNLKSGQQLKVSCAELN